MDKDEELCYLMNPTLYDKYKKLSSNEQQTQFIEEKKFYRKRIQQMAKDCTRFKIFKDAEEPTKEILLAYNEFARVCIEHFKITDEIEFYQQEFEGPSEACETGEGSSAAEPDQANPSDKSNSIGPNNDVELLGNFPPKKVVTMENFVKKTTTKPHRKVPPPQQKKVNVKDEKYRTKGLKKNKSKE